MAGRGIFIYGKIAGSMIPSRNQDRAGNYMMRYGGSNVKLAVVGSIGRGSSVEHNLCSTGQRDEPTLPAKMVIVGHSMGLLAPGYRAMAQAGAADRGTGIYCRYIVVCDSVRAGGNVVES